MQEFADAAVVSPTGAAILASLEANERDDVSWNEWPTRADSAAVTQAAESVVRMSFERLCALALEVGHSRVGPFCGGEVAGAALQQAPARRAIAEAIGDRFSIELHAPFDGSVQQWWWCGTPGEDWNPPEQKFVDFGQTYGCGEFPWAGLWTVSDPPLGLSELLTIAWDFGSHPYFRFGLAATGTPRVREVHRPADWRSLVMEYPRQADLPHLGWEFARWENPKRTRRWNPLSYRQPSHLGMPRHLNPDWAAVARDWDAIHLSWAGFITTDGYVDVADDTVTMLRYWGSERTLWLSDPGGDIIGAAAPELRDVGFGEPAALSTLDADEATEGRRTALSRSLGRR